jgi:glycosyltransferase involved in cell wall biosynthesis
MRIILTIDSLESLHGGPSRSVPALALALEEAGACVELWCLIKGDNSFELPMRRFACVAAVRQAVSELDPAENIIHDNGIWLYFCWQVCREARRRGISYVISPRGMLDSWSLKQSYLKKQIAWWLYQRSLLQSASLLHATSQLEADGIRRVGLTTPIVIHPNGVNLPILTPSPTKPFQTVAYLSRLHAKKGLGVLLESWAAAHLLGWKLRIAGKGDPIYERDLRASAVRLGIADQVEWMGDLNDKDKWDFLAGSDFFVLPSYSENFGIVVAEALAASLPVITTTGTPWADLEARGCGKCIAAEPAALTAALREFAELSLTERLEMGQRGRDWMEKSFSWKFVAEQFLLSYGAITKP